MRRRPARRRLPPLLATVAVAAACGDRPAAPAAAIRDSAGVRIVEYASWAPPVVAWRVAATPLLAIGALEGDEAYQFDRLQSVTRLTDGRIVVANGGTQELRLFAPDGRHLSSLGRKGGGPGEFEGLSLVRVVAGDTLVTYDWNLRRLSVFAPDRGFVRSVAIEFAGGLPNVLGVFGSGTVLATRGFVFGPGEMSGVVRDTAPFLRFGPDGRLLDSIGRWPSWEYYVQGDRSSVWASSLPFGRTTLSAVTRTGFWVGATDRYEIERRDSTGVLAMIVRATRPARAVTPEDVERVKADRLEDADENWRRRQERMFREMPIPSTLPAFAALQTDPDGNLWVLDTFTPSDSVRRWAVFAPDGLLRGTVETPPSVRVLEIGRDYVLGTWEDELGVQYVRMYRLERERG